MMEEKNLLKEITFLSRLIGQHKSQSRPPVFGATHPPQRGTNKLQQSPRAARTSACEQSAQTQRRVVLKKTSLSVSVANAKPVVPAPTAAARSVHINPNFLAKAQKSKESAVHVNPNFFKRAKDPGATATATLMCKSVHINPRLLSATQAVQKTDRSVLFREASERTVPCRTPEKSLPEKRFALSETLIPERIVRVTKPNVEECAGKIAPVQKRPVNAASVVEKKTVAVEKRTCVADERKLTAIVEKETSAVEKKMAATMEKKTTAVEKMAAGALPEMAASGAGKRASATPAEARRASPAPATPARPPSARRKYAYRSKTKLVKAAASLGGGLRTLRTHTGSTLLSLSRTKLVRLPGRGRRASGGGPPAAATAAAPPRVPRTPAGSTLLAISRTKLVRLPGRTRRLSTSKAEATPTPTSTSTLAPAASFPIANVTKTRYRLRRSSSSAGVQSPVIRLARKVCSKYKFRSSISPAVASTFRLDRRTGKPTPRRVARSAWSGAGLGNRYKVDHRAGTTSNVSATPTSVGRVRAHLLLSPLRRPALSAFGNRVWARAAAMTPKVVLSHKRLSRIGNNPSSRNYRQNSALVRIGGLLYKSSRNKLILSKTPNKTSPVNTKLRTVVKRRLSVGGHVVYVRGDKFVMDSSGKTMQRVVHDGCSPSVSSARSKKKRCVSRIDIGGVTYIQKSPNVLVRTNTHRARNVVSNAKQKSIAFLAKKMRKINTPCLFYRRFGRCPRLEKGRCEHVHDPKYIDICKKFLQGKCSLDGCLLSHNVGPEKMPTCRFFLEGCCVRDSCPYLHVKVSDRAPICRNFLQGYCADGPECLKRHITLCPEFDEKGSCSKGKYCPYPHSSAPRNPRATCSDPPITRLKGEEDGADARASSPSHLKRKRYYEADSVLKDPCSDTQSNEDSDEEDNVDESTAESNCGNFATRKRAKIGDLPSFIALE